MSQTKHRPSYRLKAFHGFSKVNAFISRFFEGIHSAVFMGLVDDCVFQEHDTYPFGEWEGAAEVADNARYLEEWLGTFIANEVRPDSRVLVVGAGGGRELIKLREMGCSVSAIEFDESLFAETSAMLAKAEEAGFVDLKQAERFNFDSVASDFDVVIVPRYYTSYVPGRDERVRFLAACCERLNDDGVIAFDYFTRPENALSPGALIFRIQPLISNVLRLFRGGKNRRIETGDHLDPHVPLLHHHFNQEGLNQEISASGLSLIEQGETWYGWAIARPAKRKSERSTSVTSAPATAVTATADSHSTSPVSV